MPSKPQTADEAYLRLLRGEPGGERYGELLIKEARERRRASRDYFWPRILWLRWIRRVK